MQARPGLHPYISSLVSIARSIEPAERAVRVEHWLASVNRTH